MNLLTFDSTIADYIDFNSLFLGMPCRKIHEAFRIDFTHLSCVGIRYDYGLAGDYIVNDNGRLEIFTQDQVEKNIL